MAKRIIPEADSVIFFPLDLSWLGRKVVAKIRPKIFLLVETELWPNFLYAIREYDIPVLMVNGRISEKSVNRYRHLRSILRDMMATVALFCMQSEIDAQYIIRLGAPPRQVVVTGNTKFDQTYTDVTEPDREEFLHQLGLSGRWPILVAGSTHPGEEEILYTAFQKVKETFPQAGLVIAPREIMRTEKIIELAAKYKLRGVRRTEQEPGAAGADVVILDTIGELGRIYSVGVIVYVGGSLVPHGGHNLLEPAAHGKPILVGPHMFNFKDSYGLLNSRKACDTVYDDADLAEKILYLLNNDQVRNEMGQEALAIIGENRGAAWKSVQHIKQVLEAAGNR